MEAIIETRELTKRYDETIAVDGIDLSIAEGKISCLLGPNGSGKTTTVAMLTTLRSPTSGTGTVCGYDIVEQPAQVRAAVGVTLQQTGLDDLMTGREMLKVQATLQGLTGADGRRRTDALIDLLDLGGYVDKHLGEWSGGMRRRMDLAAALVHQPRLLFLDEPTTGLDPAGRRALWAEILRLNCEDGVSVLMTTQYLEEAEALADDIVIVKAGSIIAAATPDDLKRSHGDRTFVLEFADTTGAATAQADLGGEIDPETPALLRLPAAAGAEAALLRDVAATGADLASLRVAEPSLEDIFLHLTDTKELV